ncbi:ANTAR domain-containing protein [Clostridium celatum]|uniref:ANTAR domain-containing response regulator n=1 Tax=Clostridium celatum TaxID=36834 RepID=UPI001F20AA7E|nr:ANTAR domain-containing protein [Clostridium celatum]MCE9654655.1 ANTAR domain-containing protein [Clostridium celatum]
MYLSWYKGAIFIDSVLIVSSSKKGITFFTEMLSQNSYEEIVTVTNGGEARRLLVERDFDLCIINAPLVDEFGDEFASNIVSNGIGQAILVVKTDIYNEVSEKVEKLGVITIAKPMNRAIFWSALKIATSTFNKISILKNENNKLLQKIEDIRMIDRAKCILIQYLNMTEAEAHRYIEKQAMDMRTTKRSIADGILKTYEN